jgi:hypothetical protein
MPDTKISAMTAATSLAGSETLPIVQGGANKKAAASLINAGALIYLDADYTLTSQTAAQKLFNTSANGRLTIGETGLYEFDGMVYLTGMSGTSGNGMIDILGGGTATLAGQMFHTVGHDTSFPVGPGAQSGAWALGASNTPTNVVLAGTGTAMTAAVKGIFKVTAGGTMIPSIALVTAAAAIVEAGSWWRVRKLADAGVLSVGAWD